MSAEQLAADADAVVAHVLRDEQGFYGIHAPDHDRARLVIRVAEARFANDMELATVIGWVLTTLPWTGRFRPLTAEEILIHAAALRVSEFLSILPTLGRFRYACQEQNWDDARQCWLQLAPHHALIISVCPDAALVTVVLHDLTPPATH
ncbi:MAG: hypothetical protein QM736_15145 [Vicinamibacterales bacterium]